MYNYVNLSKGFPYIYSENLLKKERRSMVITKGDCKRERIYYDDNRNAKGGIKGMRKFYLSKSKWYSSIEREARRPIVLGKAYKNNFLSPLYENDVMAFPEKHYR
jgi:hypothetical protein